MAPLLSVIIPTLNEAQTIQSVLEAAQRGNPPGAIELIVVDGGSQDDTVAVATPLATTVITTSLGRAHQMNAGAELARGDLLLFLHADTYLPANSLDWIQQTLTEEVAAGAFELAIAGKQPGLRLVEWGVQWRSRWLQLPYGDQALFMRSTTFHQVGGFPDLPIMEDFALVQRLRSLGAIKMAPVAVTTSGRRWQKLGIWRTTLLNQAIVVAYGLGVSPQRLATWYRGRKTN